MERLSLRPLLPRRNYFRRGDFRHTSVKQGCLGRYCDPETSAIRNRSPFSRPRPKGPVGNLSIPDRMFQLSLSDVRTRPGVPIIAGRRYVPGRFREGKIMGLIITLIVGGIIGWLASIVMRTDAQQGIILNVVVGIVGAFIGSFLGSFFGMGASLETFSPIGLLWAFIGDRKSTRLNSSH